MQKAPYTKPKTVGIVYKKPVEACPHNLAPTSSTTLMLVIGDCGSNVKIIRT